MNYDLELISGFIDETRDVIDQVEPDLIELSHSSGGDKEVTTETINAVFRLFHSMKSSAAFLGFNNIAKLTHEAESLIQNVRDGLLDLNGDLASLLCQTMDLITEMINTIESEYSDAAFETTIIDTLEALQSFNGSGKAEEEPVKQEKTSSIEAEQVKHTEPVDQEREMAKASLTPEMYSNFVAESTEQIETIEEKFLSLEKNGFDKNDIDSAYRAIHSFKGNCSFMHLDDMQNFSHLIETVMGSMREKKTDISPDNISFLLEAVDLLRTTVHAISENHENSTIPNIETYTNLMNDIFSDCFIQSSNTEEKEDDAIPAPVERKKALTQNVTDGTSDKRKDIVRKDIRVNLDKLDHIINLAGELVIAESMVTRNPQISHIEEENFSRSIHQLRRICSELQDASMSLRMIPLDSTFKKMVRVVHDLSRKMDKKIKLEIVGGETEVDKTVIENIGDPLVHIIRNSCDHGVESTDRRLSTGKPATGTIKLEGRHEGGEVWIIISDDGAGLDRERIIHTAIKRGVIDSVHDMSDNDVWRLIFEPGFSTAEKITDVSGRGVGMDVVKRNIEKMNGQIDIHSTPGKGTSFVIRIPLTLAIIDGMLVQCGKSLYTIPTLSIKKSITAQQKDITKSPEGREILAINGNFTPIIKLGEVYKQNDAVTSIEEGILILTKHDNREIALLADKIIGQQQTVIKGLPGYIHKVRGTSGCTILGDGSVSLILDIRTLMEIAEEQSQKTFA